jgi:hypothetical protein
VVLADHAAKYHLAYGRVVFTHLADTGIPAAPTATAIAITPQTAATIPVPDQVTTVGRDPVADSSAAGSGHAAPLRPSRGGTAAADPATGSPASARSWLILSKQHFIIGNSPDADRGTCCACGDRSRRVPDEPHDL